MHGGAVLLLAVEVSGPGLGQFHTRLLGGASFWLGGLGVRNGQLVLFASLPTIA